MEKDAVDSLKDWFKTEGRRKGWFAAQVPVCQPQVSRWLARQAVPTAAARARIETITEGAVRADSWNRR